MSVNKKTQREKKIRKKNQFEIFFFRFRSKSSDNEIFRIRVFLMTILMKSKILLNFFFRKIEKLVCHVFFDFFDRIFTESKCENEFSADLNADKTEFDDSKCR